MITLAITTYNRTDFVIESFSSVLDNDHINEVVIVDDFSDIDIYNDLKSKIESIDNHKIKLYRNDFNLKPLLNKLEAIKFSQNDWVILLDSDNKITNEYVNLVWSLQKNENTLYLPQKLLHFDDEVISDFSKYGNVFINKKNIKNYLVVSEITTILNVGNFFINKKKYLDAFDNTKVEKNLETNDALYFSFLWLINNSNIEIVNGLNYYHRQHGGSWYLNNRIDCDKNTNEIISRLKNS